LRAAALWNNGGEKMRIIVGKGITDKSECIADTRVTYKERLLLDFPVPARKVRVSIVKDNDKRPVVVLLFE